MKGFYIQVSNNLLEKKHIKAIGDRTAIWEYLWLLDKITKIDMGGWGVVLGGKPIKLRELAQELGKSIPRVSENIEKLCKNGYVKKLRTPYGLRFWVAKAKKRFNHKVNSRINDNAKSHSVIVNSNIRQYTVDNTKGGATHISSNSKKLDMKYSEGGFSDQCDGVVEDGEVKNPIKENKRKNYGKAIAICELYQKCCEQKRGEGDYIQKKAMLVLKVLNEIGEEKLRGLLNYYTKGFDEDAKKKFEKFPQISSAISSNTRAMYQNYLKKME